MRYTLCSNNLFVDAGSLVWNFGFLSFQSLLLQKPASPVYENYKERKAITKLAYVSGRILRCEVDHYTHKQMS
jgi:hypothetical protein